MKFELTPEKRAQVDSLLADGLKLRQIAKRLRVSESTLRWHLAMNGLRVEEKRRLVPIHPQTPNGSPA